VESPRVPCCGNASFESFPDVSSLDFYLFGKVKSALIGGDPDEIDILESVTEILNGISDAELQIFFRSWIKHFERRIDAGWNYSTE
jgi:hypothetical protein